MMLFVLFMVLVVCAVVDAHLFWLVSCSIQNNKIASGLSVVVADSGEIVVVFVLESAFLFGSLVY